jgi:hypothetical protein
LALKLGTRSYVSGIVWVPDGSCGTGFVSLSFSSLGLGEHEGCVAVIYDQYDEEYFVPIKSHGLDTTEVGVVRSDLSSMWVVPK